MLIRSNGRGELYTLEVLHSSFYECHINIYAQMEFLPLILYNILGMVHCIARGITCCEIYLLRVLAYSVDPVPSPFAIVLSQELNTDKQRVD